MMKKFFAVLTAGVMLCSSQLVVAYDAQAPDKLTAAADYTETEPNDTLDQQNKIELNTSYQGDLSSPQDIDYYSFDITEPGYINIEFSHEYIDNASPYWQLELHGQGDNLTTLPLYSYKFTGNAVDAETVTEQLQNLGVNIGSFYFTIRRQAYLEGHEDYTVKVNFTKDDHWESEWNDLTGLGNADHVELNSYTIGNSSIVGDLDFYTFTLDTDSTVHIDFSHPYIDSEFECWEIFLDEIVYDDNHYVKSLNKVWASKELFGCGNSDESRLEEGRVNETSPALDLKAGDYSILITHNEVVNQPIDYIFSIRTTDDSYIVTSTTPAVTTTTTTSVTSGKGTTTTKPKTTTTTSVTSGKGTTTTKPKTTTTTSVTSGKGTTTTKPKTTTTTSVTSGKGTTTTKSKTTTTTSVTSGKGTTTTKPKTTTTTTTTKSPLIGTGTTTATTTTTTTTAPAGQKLGDVDCSGDVDVADAVLLARFLAEDSEAYISLQGQRNADCNKSGNPDMNDVVMILKAIAMLITL